uniref:Uncharacterized protein n=1 Tax=Rhizophora mucronata TaxID=61149 RepID=A0A2P2PU25_RHIMU
MNPDFSPEKQKLNLDTILEMPPPMKQNSSSGKLKSRISRF